MRPFAKWYFDIVKNALVVAALFYFSEKTGSLIIKVIAGVSLGVLVWSLTIYLHRWEIRPFNFVTSRKWREALNILFAAATVGVMYFVCLYILNLTMHELIRAQSR
jgi:hypothetical protein